MGLLIIIVLGIIQGACEFLPISSSGHLVLFYNIFSVKENTIMLSVILHVATLLSVIVVYKNQLAKLVKKPFCKTNFLLLSSTLPTIAVFLLIEQFVVDSFSGQNLIYFFLVTAVVLLFAEMFSKSKSRQAYIIGEHRKVNDASYKNFFNTTHDTKSFRGKLKSVFYASSGYDFNISYPQAVVIGLFQGVATIPGISRSGLTISGGLLAGVHKDEVANYSFLLSIPIILASLAYELLKLGKTPMAFSFSILEMLVGFVVAFAVGYACLKIMISFVKKQKLYVFSIYLVLLALAIIVAGILTNI